MSERAKELAERFTRFNNDVIAFVEKCSDGAWRRVCQGEEWSVAVVARHVAAAHYGVLGLAKLIVAGEPLPEMTMDAINEMNAQHAQEHANCSKDEVLSILRDQGSSIAAFMAGLSDADLDRTAYLALTGGDMSAQQFIEAVILQSGGGHLASMKATAGA
jgi:uncharacterized damage-inducible protein DinB